MKISDIDDVDTYLNKVLTSAVPPFEASQVSTGNGEHDWRVHDANGRDIYSVACDVLEQDSWGLAQAMADMLNALVIQREQIAYLEHHYKMAAGRLKQIGEWQ